VDVVSKPGSYLLYLVCLGGEYGPYAGISLYKCSALTGRFICVGVVSFPRFGSN